MSNLPRTIENIPSESQMTVNAALDILVLMVQFIQGNDPIHSTDVDLESICLLQ